MAIKKSSAYLPPVLFLLAQLLFAAFAAPGQAQTPVGYWTFDDGSGTTAADSSGNSHTATLVNGSTWVTGKTGGAVSANAAMQQYVSIPAIPLSGTKAVTVAFWANRTYSNGGGHALFEATSNYTNSTTGFGFFPDDSACNGIQAALQGNVGYTANCYSQPSSGVWHHLTVVFDKSQTAGNQIAFYVDGVLQTVTRNLYASTNTNNFGNNPIYLFSRAGATQFNSGSMDDLRIYSKALTAAQIQQIYKSTTLVSLAVTPTNPSIVRGAQQQFTATGTYGDGSQKILSSWVTWTSTAPSVASITSGGLPTAIAVGSTTVKASFGSVSGSTNLIVTAPVLVSIAVTPATASITVGQQQQFTATGTYSDGSQQNLTNSVSWTSTGPSVATINSSGLAAAIAVGSTTIKAASGPITASSSLTVTGNSITLDGSAHGVRDNGLSASTTATVTIGTPTASDLITCAVSFDSGNNNTLVSVSDNQNGTYSAAVPVHLNAAMFQSFGIYYRENVAGAPTAITLTTSQSRPYSAISCQAWRGAATSASLDSAFVQLRDATATSNPTTGGNKTPAVNGELVIAAVGLVQAGPPSPGTNYTVIDGATTTQWWPEYWAQTTATPTAGNFTWPTDSFTDLMAAFRPSTAPPLVSVTVAPSNPSIAAGQQQQFTATGTYGDGSQQNLTNSATWTSTAPSVATVSSAGLATAIAAGSTTIKAVSGSISGSTSLTVAAPTLVSIAVTPANPSIAAGQQQQFTATGTYSDGSQQNLTNSVSWTSTAPSVATVSSVGLATAIAAGSTTIQATSGSISGTTGLTVTGAAPSEISNIQIQNVTQTSFDVVWSTVHPSTSQVVWARDTNYEPEAWYPQTADPNLVTSHRITVGKQMPSNTVYVYVASVTAAGQMSTSPGPDAAFIAVTTLDPNLGSTTPNTTAYTYGPHTAYVGYDMYFEVDPVLISGPQDNLYIRNVTGYNNGSDGVVSPAASIGVHYMCQTGNDTAQDANDQWFDSNTNLGYCYNGNYGMDNQVRLRVPAGTTPGAYTVTLTLLSDGVSFNVVYPFTVANLPTITPASKTPIAIPNLSTWETQMTALGNKWCTDRDTQDAQGNFEAFGVTQQSWYYDGGRVFQQLDDYTANVLGQPNHPHWQHCAQAVLYPYMYWETGSNGLVSQYKKFTAGMLMNYWRTGLAAAQAGVMAIGSSYTGKGYVDISGVRENGYNINSFLGSNAVGNALPPWFGANVTLLLGQMQQCAEGTGAAGSSAHPALIGLGVEALTRVYRYNSDPRIVPIVKGCLDALWAANWNSNGWMNYNRLALPPDPTSSSELNNLVAQGYAWLWYMTGDTTEQNRANLLFGAAFSGDPGNYNYTGKEFSQEYEFSFDTVRLLQNNGVSYTDRASNPNAGSWPVTTPPTIVQESNIVSGTSATISWSTYIPTNSQVVYGKTAAYGQQTPVSDAGGVRLHSVKVNGLSSGTYHYIVKSVDTVGNVGQSADDTFVIP